MRMKQAANKKILIIDDDPNIRNAFIRRFIEEGFIALSASDGQAGLDLALKTKPDLILLDIVMPEMDGMTMLQKLRQDAWGASAKVIILTDLNEIVKTPENLARESFCYLVKSEWKIEDVMARAKEMLERE